MNRERSISALILASVLALGVVACGGGETAGAGREKEFAAVREQKAALDQKRDEISALEMQIAAAAEMVDPAEGEAVEGEEATGEESPSAEDLEAQLERENAGALELSDTFMTALVTFLNSANMVADEAPTGVQLEAIRMKSSEDLLIAQDYIDQGGDYRRAIEILDTSLMVDPENADLLAAREQATLEQFMTAERSEAAHKGMTQAEVRSVLGTPNPHNVREYPEKNVVAWFYRREDRGAAGVWFEEQNGVLTAYRAEFDAIKPNDNSQ